MHFCVLLLQVDKHHGSFVDCFKCRTEYLRLTLQCHIISINIPVCAKSTLWHNKIFPTFSSCLFVNFDLTPPYIGFYIFLYNFNSCYFGYDS